MCLQRIRVRLHVVLTELFLTKSGMDRRVRGGESESQGNSLQMLGYNPGSAGVFSIHPDEWALGKFCLGHDPGPPGAPGSGTAG
jgi:hypothetical protein